jgi:predicted ATPase with chaperone activity
LAFTLVEPNQDPVQPPTGVWNRKISGPLFDRIDLDSAPAVRRIHVAEALSYRRIALSG